MIGAIPVYVTSKWDLLDGRSHPCYFWGVNGIDQAQDFLTNKPQGTLAGIPVSDLSCEINVKKTTVTSERANYLMVVRLLRRQSGTLLQTSERKHRIKLATKSLAKQMSSFLDLHTDARKVKIPFNVHWLAVERYRFRKRKIFWMFLSGRNLYQSDQPVLNCSEILYHNGFQLKTCLKRVKERFKRWEAWVHPQESSVFGTIFKVKHIHDRKSSYEKSSKYCSSR